MDSLLAQLPANLYIQLSVAVLSVYFASRAYQIASAFKHKSVYGFYPVLGPNSVLGLVLPESRLNPTYLWGWIKRSSGYANFNYDILALTPILTGTPRLFIGSFDVAMQILGKDTKVGMTKMKEFSLESLFGPGVGNVNGEVWKRQRKIVVQAFTPDLYPKVVQEIPKIYEEMFHGEGWENRSQFELSSLAPIVQKFIFQALCRCALGIPLTWNTPPSEPLKPNFSEALHTINDTIVIQLLAPRWLHYFPIQRLREIDAAWVKFRQDMHDFQESKGDGEVEGNTDILTRLIESTKATRLDQAELMANVSTLLSGGYETSSSGVSTVLACLAIHQDEQNTVYNEIKDFFAEGPPSIRDPSDVPYLKKCFFEGLRLVPPAFFLPREIQRPTIVNIQRPHPETILLPVGTTMLIDLISIFRNPHTYPDPDRFRPSRWCDVNESEILLFGAGPRVCIGRRFAIATSVSLLALILRDYHIDITLKNGETRQDYEGRVFNGAKMHGTAFALSSFPLIFTRRGTS